MTEPTKGPWRVSDADQYMVVSPNKSISNAFNIAFVDGRVSDDEEEIIANARLISAAPELLAVAEQVVSRGHRYDCGQCYHRLNRCSCSYLAAISAIAKARGV